MVATAKGTLIEYLLRGSRWPFSVNPISLANVVQGEMVVQGGQSCPWSHSHAVAEL